MAVITMAGVIPLTLMASGASSRQSTVTGIAPGVAAASARQAAGPHRSGRALEARGAARQRVQARIDRRASARTPRGSEPGRSVSGAATVANGATAAGAVSTVGSAAASSACETASVSTAAPARCSRRAAAKARRIQRAAHRSARAARGRDALSGGSQAP